MVGYRHMGPCEKRLTAILSITGLLTAAF